MEQANNPRQREEEQQNDTDQENTGLPDPGLFVVPLTGTDFDETGAGENMATES